MLRPRLLVAAVAAALVVGACAEPVSSPESTDTPPTSARPTESVAPRSPSDAPASRPPPDVPSDAPSDAASDPPTTPPAATESPEGTGEASEPPSGPTDPFDVHIRVESHVDELCLPYDTYGRYSCQNGPVVALNADRWRGATPSWTRSVEEYRTMLVNHEVGHLLHLHHPSPQCPGDGYPAPVMMQQSTELGRCTANPWPLDWEIALAAERREPLAPPAEHDVSDHRPSPPPER